MRITGGQYKNRKLFVPEGNDVRPTSDRMRQTIFNLLHHANWLDNFQLNGAIVLDLYCGSGALGIEALSHGANKCVFVDRDIISIKQNSNFLYADSYQIIKADASQLSNGRGCVNLVFMDPPYFKNLIEPTVANLINNNWLADEALIVIEAEKSLMLDLPLILLDKRGQSHSNLHVFRYKAAINDGEQSNP